ncbi:MAG: FG-GAP repeat domain-containing protein [Planctomycetota bacterium]
MDYRRTEWTKIKIDDGTFEAAAALDVNNDGALDIVCGGFWYQAPDWTKHKLCDVLHQNEYYDDFSTVPMDVNGDGYTDIVTGGWFGKTLVWRENPKGQPVEWQTHPIDECGNIETTRAWDLDGDGELEVVPNTPGEPLAFYKLARDADGRPTGEFRKIVIGTEPSGHGLGFGTIGGKRALVVHNGWWEAPDDPLGEPWTFHEEFDIGHASVPVLVVDFNGDGLSELIVGQAHGYGLHWWQQTVAPDGSRSWTRHPIDPYFAQYHCLEYADVDGDGASEIITGNRYRAHNGGDPGATEVVGVYVFKWNGESWTKQIVDHGRVPGASGTGIYFDVADLDGDGRLDLLCPGKDGLYLFLNAGPEGGKEYGT